MEGLLVLALLAAAPPEDQVLVGPTLPASWIWAADGVKVRRSGLGQYDGFPVEKDPARGDDAVVVVQIPEAAPGGVIHGGLAFKGDYKPLDCSAYRESGVLELWVRGEAGGEDVELGLYGAGTDGSKQMSILPLSRFAKVTRDWQRVRIPVKDLALQSPRLDLSKANQVAIHTIAGESALTLRLASFRLTIPAGK
jgi:hypothetical protein